MVYYAVNSTDSGSNTGWIFATTAQYFAINSLDQGNNTGWIFESGPILPTNGQTAAIDENGIMSLLGTQNTINPVPVRIYAVPSTHQLLAIDGTTGLNFGPKNAPRDQNNTPCLLAISSVDGVTPVVVYADPDTHSILVKST